MADELPLMFTIWIRNDSTKEATQIKGQGTSVPAAFKEGWENACEAYGKGSSGEFISAPHLGVKLPTGEVVFRSPGKFASAKPYDAAIEAKEFAAPICEGAGARPYDGPMRSYKGGAKA